MSRQKFFSLLHGEAVHTAPKGKIIPAEELGEVLTATELLERVQQDAQRYRLEVAQECEVIKERARQEGFEAGYATWLQHVAELEQEIARVHKTIEKTVLPVALKAAKKILGRELELSETAIVDIIADKLKAVAQHKRIIIYVNKDEFVKVEKSRERIKKIFENLEALSIRPRDDIASGGCMIETEVGIINGKIESQWELIERAFQMLKTADKAP